MIKAAATAFSKISSTLPPVAKRGADAERRALIMDKGEEVFLEEGFQGASMAEIAARAGCSKGTLYNYFESKDELFLACVARHCEGLQEEMLSLARSGGDVRQTLTDIGRSYVQFVSSDHIVRRFRMIAAEGERTPQITRAFYAMGPGRGVETLTAYIASAMDAGALRQSDAARAARNFFSLCNGHRIKARLCNAEAEPAPAEVDADVAEAVRVFMAGYGALARRLPVPLGCALLSGLAGVLGFEPRNGGTKNRCLTTWRHPNDPGLWRPRRGEGRYLRAPAARCNQDKSGAGARCCTSERNSARRRTSRSMPVFLSIVYKALKPPVAGRA